MRALSALLISARALVVAGCGSCGDGERSKPPEVPRPDRVVSDGGVGQVAGPDAELISTETLGYLDMPAGSLDMLYQGLAGLEAGGTGPAGRVLLLFFGDSHTAGDSMTSHVRVAWQHRFGDAGRGLVAAGRPTARHYYQRDVRYGRSGRWRSAVGGHRDPEPYGILGLRVYGDRKGSELWVETCADCKAGNTVGQFAILYQATPTGGALKLRVDEGRWQTLNTRTAAIEPPHPARHVIVVPDGPHKLTLEHAGGGNVDLYGVSLERQHPGVIVDACGVVGRRLGQLRSWDWSIIGEQLATRDPRLVVLQYGTNEADDPNVDVEAIARYYDDTILRIRASAPTASILILGPPDMGVREAGRTCDRKKKKGKHEPEDAGVPPECEWHTPAILREIIAVQHAAALRNRVAFFDTFAAMGGGEQMDAWANADPRVAFRDRTHFTDVGYRRWADALSNALFASYARWREAQHLPPSTALAVVQPAH